MTVYCCKMLERGVEPNCSEHPNAWDCPDALVGTVGGGFGLIVHARGGSMIEIAFCPWCGAKLPAMQDISGCP
jgi:hypothetical protein